MEMVGETEGRCEEDDVRSIESIKRKGIHLTHERKRGYENEYESYGRTGWVRFTCRCE